MLFYLAAWKIERLLSTWKGLLLMKISIFLVEKGAKGRNTDRRTGERISMATFQYLYNKQHHISWLIPDTMS